MRSRTRDLLPILYRSNGSRRWPRGRLTPLRRSDRIRLLQVPRSRPSRLQVKMGQT